MVAGSLIAKPTVRFWLATHQRALDHDRLHLGAFCSLREYPLETASDPATPQGCIVNPNGRAATWSSFSSISEAETSRFVENRNASDFGNCFFQQLQPFSPEFSR